MKFCAAWQDEVLFGGAAGPGKTDCLIMEALRFVEFSDYQGIIFRRTFPMMQEIIDRTRDLYPMVDGDYRASEHRWSFPTGASIFLAHMADDGSEYNYQGKQYQYIAFDEAGQFLPKQLQYLFSRCRSTNPAIPKRVRYASNPGGPAHQWLKDRFQLAQYPDGGKTFWDEVDVILPGGIRVVEKMSRTFVPGRIQDNPSLFINDPQYIARLMQLPNIERMRLLEGRWDAFEGQFFSELNRELHGFDGELPHDWEVFGAFDWGYARPWVYQIWRVDYDGRLWLDHQHYGAREGFINVGVRQTDTEISRKIMEIESDLKVKPRWRVAGADIWNPKRRKDGMIGPAPNDTFAMEGITFIRADTNRIQGWQQIHHRLLVDEDGEPMLKVRNSLEDWWRTMLQLQEDPRNPEDLPTRDIEDHAAECTRYMVMTRPMRPQVAAKDDHGTFQAERRKLIDAKRRANRFGITIDKAYRTR